MTGLLCMQKNPKGKVIETVQNGLTFKNKNKQANKNSLLICKDELADLDATRARITDSSLRTTGTLQKVEKRGTSLPHNK